MMSDSKRVLRKDGKKYDTFYRAACNKCGVDRGYHHKTRLDRSCYSCNGKAISEMENRFSSEAISKMVEAKLNHTPWNKGKKETRPEVKLKQALAKVGKVPWNKGTANVLATDAVKNKVRHLVRRYIKGAPSTLWLEDVVGLSQAQLKNYIESKFIEGMSWDNWTIRGWHLDHIQPLASFDLNNPEELKKACHYSNFQPLWAEDNLKKSSK